MFNNDNKHQMLTRSKRKKNNININELEELDFSEEENISLEIKPVKKKQKILDERVDNVYEDDKVYEPDIVYETENVFETDDDIDEYGNVKDLIDYDFFEPKTVRNEYRRNDREYRPNESEFRQNESESSTESNYSYDSFDSDDYAEDNDESIIGKLLAKYINKNMMRDDGEMIENELNPEYLEILHNYNPSMISYFQSLDEDQKEEIINIEKEINTINKNTIPLRFQILKSKISNDIKAIAIRKIETLKNLEPNSTEYYKIKGWVDGLLNIPFGNYKELPISLKNSQKDITKYLINANQTLNKAVFGHKKAKCQILQIVSQWISNPRSKGSVFAIVGPMGNGKTTLVKEGISKMINRPFQFISLGGATDSSFFDGHSYTYEGSQPGKIVEILKKSKCMNPVIYFDELDKVSETPKGEEIINLLIHMTDFSQNDHFMDKYYNDIPLDLSKALFIFSLNNMEKVNPILRDRMYMIHTNKLSVEEKITISKNYLIPSLCKEIAINDIIFEDEIIKYIIDNFSKEDGVRNLRRSFETILSKLNIIRITQSCNITDLELPYSIDNFKLPLKITKDIIHSLIEKKINNDEPPFGMYC